MQYCHVACCVGTSGIHIRHYTSGGITPGGGAQFEGCVYKLKQEQERLTFKKKFTSGAEPKTIYSRGEKRPAH